MKNRKSNSTRSVSRWFSAFFLAFSLIFCVILIPLYLYLHNTFYELELEKSKTQLSIGTLQLDSAVSGILNASQALKQDSRYLVYLYEDPDYSNIDATSRIQMKNTFQSLMAQQGLFTDCAIQFEQNVAITPNSVFFNGYTLYYPDFFQYGGDSYEQWLNKLQKNSTGFLPVQHICTKTSSYDALVYATKWNTDAYLYACMDMNRLKKELVPVEDANDLYYIAIYNNRGEQLYSDLPEHEAGYRTISDTTSTGGLRIDVYIPSRIFSEKMKPAYLFLAIYTAVFLFLLSCSILIGTRFSVKPIRKIINILEKSSNLNFMDSANQRKARNEFDQIASCIAQADRDINKYRDALDAQHEILQARFFEKAIGGQLGSQEDLQRFQAYFGNFPDAYRLLMARFQVNQPDAKEFCAQSILIIQSFLKSEMPDVYLQQFSDSELLLLIPEELFSSCRKTLDFIINNINSQEPALTIRCIASNVFQRHEDLPLAFRQLQDLECCSFAESTVHICTALDQLKTNTVPFYMTDLQTLYTAITSGNDVMALNKLNECAERISSIKNPVFSSQIFDFIRSMLICVRMEHPETLLEQEIPICHYQPQTSLFDQLAPSITSLCKKISAASPSKNDTLANEIVQYIDQHYTDCDLCLSSLEEHFQCSVSKLQKSFKNVAGMTIANYIEKKRMELAEKLLAEKVKTIAEISEACGFMNINSFYKAYKRYYGHAPKANIAQKTN